MLALTLRFSAKGQCQTVQDLAPEGDEIDKFDKHAHEGDNNRPIEKQEIRSQHRNQDAGEP